MNDHDRRLHLVKYEINRALARTACPQCRSTWIKDHGIPAPHGERWHFRQCQDCDLIFDAELDA